MALSKRAKTAIAVLSGIAAAGVVGYVVYESTKDEPEPDKGNGKDKPDGDAECPQGYLFGGFDKQGTAICIPILGPEEPDYEEPKGPVKPKIPAVTGGLTGGSAKPSKVEPKGGWEFRWNQRKANAFKDCSGALAHKIENWTDFWKCVLFRAFPEVATFEIHEWPDWLKNQARPAIQDEVRAMVEAEQVAAGFPTTGIGSWQFRLWLHFDSQIDGCYESFAPYREPMIHCMAMEIFPDEDWPPSPNVADNHWSKQFWNTLSTLVDSYIASQEEAQAGGFSP